MRLATVEAESWARPISRSRSSSAEGGRMKMRTRSSSIVGAQLLGALPVDVEQHVMALLQRLHHGALGRAVEIAEHLGIFQQVATVAQAAELLMR